jgi:hypothetical protein
MSTGRRIVYPWAIIDMYENDFDPYYYLIHIYQYASTERR